VAQVTATGDAQETSQATAIPPAIRLREMINGINLSWMLYAVAERGVADLLADGPQTSIELARAAGVHEPSLYRLLRSLSSFGVFEEESPRRFSLNPLGSALKTGDPSAARDMVMLLPWFARAWAEFPRTVAGGENGMQLAFGMPVFEYLAQNPTESGNFNRTMIATGAGEPAAVAEAYDFSDVHRLVDVGGGIGTLLTTVLDRYPLVRGVLFDRPDVIDDARPTLAEHGVTERCEVVGGDFFVALPENADAYLMSHVLHDWDDDLCVAILRNCRAAIDPDGRLLIVEMVLPPGGEPHPSQMLDMIMLAIAGGMERTEEQYGELLRRGGFRLTRVVPTGSAVSVIAAVPELDGA
jgi:hypothetical protein